MQFTYAMSDEYLRKVWVETGVREGPFKPHFTEIPDTEIPADVRAIIASASPSAITEIGLKLDQFSTYRADAILDPSGVYTVIREMGKRIEDKKAADAKRAQDMIASKIASEAKAAADRIEKERTEVEKQAWIAEFGSVHLKRCIAGGYHCGRLYFIERAAQLYPDATLDYNDTAQWDKRPVPSIEALDKVDAIKHAHPDALEVTVVWMTAKPSNDADHDSFDDECAGREAIVIDDPLFGKYWIVGVL